MQTIIGDLLHLAAGSLLPVKKCSFTTQLDAFAAKIQKMRRFFPHKQATLVAAKNSLQHHAFSGTL